MSDPLKLLLYVDFMDLALFYEISSLVGGLHCIPVIFFSGYMEQACVVAFLGAVLTVTVVAGDCSGQYSLGDVPFTVGSTVTGDGTSTTFLFTVSCSIAFGSLTFFTVNMYCIDTEKRPFDQLL